MCETQALSCLQGYTGRKAKRCFSGAMDAAASATDVAMSVTDVVVSVTDIEMTVLESVTGHHDICNGRRSVCNVATSITAANITLCFSMSEPGELYHLAEQKVHWPFFL